MTATLSPSDLGELKTKQQANAKGKIFAQIIGKRALKSEEEGPPVPIDFVRSENRPARKQRSAKVNGGTKPFVNVHGVTVSDEDVAFPGKH